MTHAGHMVETAELGFEPGESTSSGALTLTISCAASTVLSLFHSQRGSRAGGTGHRDPDSGRKRMAPLTLGELN